MTPQEANDLAAITAAQLSEHFEAVQVLATYTEDGVTYHVIQGVGNWYARQGMAHEFINKDVAQENASQISQKLNPPDSDDWKKA